MITHLKLKYLGKTPRTFKLPIPFIAKSDERGEVVCNPVGEFPVEDGKALLGLGSDAFELIEEVEDGKGEVEDGSPGEMSLCACNCGKRLTWKKQYKYMKAVPKYIQGHYQKQRSSQAVA